MGEVAGLSIADRRVRKGLVFSLWEGVFATVMLAVTETFAVAAALALHAPAMAIAILGSLPLCLGSVGQLLLSTFTRPGLSRRRYVLLGAFGQSALLLACAAAGFVSAFSSVAMPWLVFVIAFVLFGVSGNLVSMFWISWMRDLIPVELRGRIFAWRQRVFAFVHLALALGLGYVARGYTTGEAPWAFFAAAFAGAALFRGLSGLMLTVQYEPARAEPVASVRGFRPSRGFLSFCVAGALLQGATALSGPFFNVWFLRDLRFDFLTFSMCAVATISGAMLFLPLWGKLADRIGHFRLLVSSALMVSIIPLPYLFFDSPYAIWSFNFYSGVAWSAYNLANFNYLLEAVGSRNAEREISVAVATTGVAVFLAGLLGGYLAENLPPVFGSSLRSLFLVSSVLRLAVVLLLFRTLKPLVAQPNQGSALDVFHEFPGYRAGMGILRTVFRGFRRQ